MPSEESSTTTSTETSKAKGDGTQAVNVKATPARKRHVRRNWYFIFIRLILIVTCVIVLFSGFLFVILGPHSLNIFGAVLSRESTADQAFNNIWRFISIMWLCYAPMCILIALDITRYGPVLVTYAVMMFAGGLARVWTAYTIGIPGTPMGWFLVQIAIFLDLTTPPLAMLLYSFGRRFEKKQA